LDSAFIVAKGIILTVIAFGLMIFVHELGHFLAMKLIGVRIERFSFGMGPRLIGRTWGDTEYLISAIPIGGYVKPAGGDEGEESTGAPDEFYAKTPGQRALALAAGPIFSVLFGIPMLMGMYLVGIEIPTSRVSHVVVASPAWDAGLRYGDRVTRLDGQPIETFDDLRLAAIQTAPDTPVPMIVERNGKDVELRLIRGKGKQEIGVFCAFLTTRVHRVSDGTPAEAAGLQPDDLLVSIDGKPLRGWPDFRRRILANPGRTVQLGLLRGNEAITVAVAPEPTPRPDPGFSLHLPREIGVVRKGFPADGHLEVGDRIVNANQTPIERWWDIEDAVANGPQTATLTVERAGNTLTIELPRGEGLRLTDTLGIAPRATYVVADVHGQSEPPLQPGDEIVEVDGQDVATAIAEGMLYTPTDDIAGALARAKHIIAVRGEERLEVAITPGERAVGKLGVEQKPDSVYRKETLLGSFIPAVKKTGESAMLVYVIFRKLFSADLSANSVAGPVGILQITYMSAQRGWSDLFYLVGMITVNIGVLNLLPVPPLDGGRLLLLIYEKIRGRKPSRKFQEAVIMTGFVLLVGVILLATFNDFRRIFF